MLRLRYFEDAPLLATYDVRGETPATEVSFALYRVEDPSFAPGLLDSAARQRIAAELPREVLHVELELEAP